MRAGSVRSRRPPHSTIGETDSGVWLVEYKDYYQTLGVAKNATAEEIKKAYRKLMRKHHPDVNQAKDASDQAKEINEAYNVLGDAQKRAAYNARGSAAPGARPFQPPPGWGANGNVDADDFFFDLFAHGGQRPRQASAYNMRGDDIHASISIDLADAYNGAIRTVTLRVPQRESAITASRPCCCASDNSGSTTPLAKLCTS